MKFMGLILMCAASSMALILPALGVVKFPVLDQQTLQALAAEAQSLGQNPVPPAPSSEPQSSAGLSAAAQVSAQQQPQETSTTTSGSTLGKIPFTQIGSQKVGLGVWLLLLPTLLVGLAMWTFGSSPKASSR